MAPTPRQPKGSPSAPLGPRAQGAGNLDKVTLEHGQRAQGQVLALLEGLLQLAQDGDPLRGAWQWVQVPDVPKPVHGGYIKGGVAQGTESGTWHPPARWPWLQAQLPQGLAMALPGVVSPAWGRSLPWRGFVTSSDTRGTLPRNSPEGHRLLSSWGCGLEP